MADMKSCLMWETERPYIDRSRKSSFFRMFGEEWCLQLSLCVCIVDDKRYVCSVKLTRRYNTQSSLSDFSATCDVIAGNLAFGDTVRPHQLGENSTFILNCSVQKSRLMPSENSSNWKIYCRFSCPRPLLLQINNETIQSIPVKSLPPRSVDECIQVSQEVPRDIEDLSTDISGLLKDGILPDFELKCGGRIFPVHRAVLAARSEVFRAMFRSRMQESESGSADIKDLEVPVLEMTLKFLYSGKLDDLSEDTASKLYEAADKYAVRSLFKACSYWLMRNLTVDNCISYLYTANSHSDPDLKAAAVSFILAHPGVFNSTAWLTFLKEHLVLASEVLQTYAASSAASALQ